MRRCLLLAALIFVPITSFATTAPDLSGRIIINGDIRDYQSDEWILDSSSDLAESREDSRWGPHDDVHRVVVTWDSDYLYIAAEARLLDASLMVFLQYGGGGVSRLDGLGLLRRQIHLGTLRPNVIVLATPGGPVDVARVDGYNAIRWLSEDEARRALAVPVDVAGGFEAAVPWSQLGGVPAQIDLLVAVTAGPGSGAGDGAPDPSSELETDRNATAALDRFARVVVDADGDGAADLGISPRAATSVSPPGASTAPSHAGVDVRVERKSFAPDLGESTTFRLCSDAESTLYVTARVYSLSGVLVRVLYQDEPRVLSPPAAPDPRDAWDGTDRDGRVVAGGIYVINVSWGDTRGAASAKTNASVAVVR